MIAQGEGATLVVVIALTLGAFMFAFMIDTLVKCLRVPEGAKFQSGSKATWVVVILLTGVIGAALYRSAGHPVGVEDSKRPSPTPTPESRRRDGFILLAVLLGAIALMSGIVLLINLGDKVHAHPVSGIVMSLLWTAALGAGAVAAGRAARRSARAESQPKQLSEAIASYRPRGGSSDPQAGRDLGFGATLAPSKAPTPGRPDLV